MSTAMLISSGKTASTDQKFDADQENCSFSNYVFLRLVGRKRKFTKVNFKYSFFDTCYLRDCHFDSCDFTGCRFVNTNLHGAKFSGCTFDYATFEKTTIDSKILDTECPGLENLKLRFARTLRTNFQQLGDADAVNKAMKVEMGATAIHLHKAAWSNEKYYRSHYKGWTRLKIIAEWVQFRALDLLWGNGENLLRLIRFIVFILCAMTITDAIVCGDAGRVQSYVSGFARAIEIFFGTIAPEDYWKGYLALITFLRLVIIALFISILIRKFSRR